MLVFHSFNIIHQPDSFYEKLVLDFSFEEKKYNLTAEFHMRTEKEYDDFFHSYELVDQEGCHFLWKDFNSILLKRVYKYIREKIDEENDFFDYHYTGGIRESAYENMNIDYAIEDYSRLIKTFQDKKGEEIQFRQSGETLKYVKKDENDEILRDEKGNALYLSEKEMKEKKLPLYETTVIAFNSKGESVAVASDEFGADGIWVVKSYQRRGIGTELLHEFRKQFNENRRIGQMTPSGIRAAKAYFRKYIQKKD